MSKPFWRSRTVWSNVLSILGAAGLAALGTITPTTALATAGLAAANVGLRAITNQAITATQENTNA